MKESFLLVEPASQARLVRLHTLHSSQLSQLSKTLDPTCSLPPGAASSIGGDSKCKTIIREMQERLRTFRGGRAHVQVKRMATEIFITCLHGHHADLSISPAGLTLVSSLVYFKLCTCRRAMWVRWRREERTFFCLTSSYAARCT